MLCRLLWSCLWATTIAAQTTTSLLSPVADQRFLMPSGLGAATASAVADMNRDGRMDLVRVAGDELIVFLQDKTGRFSFASLKSRILFPPTSGGIRSVAVGQFDADKHLDIVVGLGGAPDQILRGDGAGSFALRSPSPIPQTAFVSTRSILVGDFDGRNGDDLIVLAQFASPVMLLADGAGGFKSMSSQLPTSFVVGYSTGCVVDIDGDGDLDLVLASDQRAQSVVLLNNGRADFRNKPITLPNSNLSVRSVEVGDVDGDSLQDLVFVGASTGAVLPPEVWRNTGSGFTPYKITSNLGTSGILGLALRDLDNDRLVDLIVVDASGAVHCALNAGFGAFKSSHKLLGEGSRGAFAVVDLEGDGDVDIYLAGHSSEDAFLYGDGRGDFFDPRAIGQRFPHALGGQMTALVDINHDGDLDLLFYNKLGEAATWLNVGGSRFVQRRGLAPALPAGGGYFDIKPVSFGSRSSDLVVLGSPGPANPQGIRCLQLTAKGYQDVTAVLWPQPANTLFLRMATGRFTRSAGPSELVVADGAQGLRLYRVVGGAYQEVLGAFGNWTGSTREFVCGDINGDGLDDLVVLPNLGVPEVFLGKPTGFVRLGKVSAAIAQAVSGEVVDVTGDKLPDLLLATPRQGSGIRILVGDGSGKFRDGTSAWAPNLTAPGADSLAYLESRGTAFIVVGRPGLRDLVLRRTAVGYARVATTWMHGGRDTAGYRSVDIDGDGDDDLLVLRGKSGPTILWNRGLQLTQLGTGQSGRAVVLSLEGLPRTNAFLFASPTMARLDIPGLGLLRLASPFAVVTLPIPASGRATVSMVVPSGLTAGIVPLQFAMLDVSTSRIKLSNLEPLILTGH